MYNGDQQIAAAPMPTRRTLWLRRSIPVQLVRFALTNLRMVRMVTRGHGDRPTKG